MTNQESLLKVYRSDDRQLSSSLFICEGRWVVESLLASSLPVHSLVLVEGKHEDLAETVPSTVPVLRISAEEAEALLGFHFHRGVLAAATAPPPQSFVDWLAADPTRTTDTRPLVIVPHLADPSNLGALIRNAAALDAAAVLVGDAGASPWYRKAVRTSSGMVFKIPVLVSPNLKADIAALARDATTTLAALTLTPEARPIQSFDLGDKRLALLMGPEGPGLSPRWLKHCNECVRIPMANGVDSLNVATSAALMLYHCKKNVSDFT